MIESKLFALTSILLPREMLFYEPEVLSNSWKDKNLEAECDIEGLHKMVTKKHVNV